MKDTHPLTADEAIQHINTHATDDSIACIRDDDHRDRFHVHFAEDLIRIRSRVDFTRGPEGFDLAVTNSGGGVIYFAVPHPTAGKG